MRKNTVKKKVVKPQKTKKNPPLLEVVHEAAEDLKAQNIVEIDLRNYSSFTDFFVIMSGTSDRHVKSIADSIVEKSKKSGVVPMGVEGYETGRWVLIDLGDIVIHVFQEEDREYYQIEEFWKSGKHLESI